MDINFDFYSSPRTSSEHFLSALLYLLKENNYSDITVVQICKKAGFSRKTFYEKFSQKDDLLDFLVENLCRLYKSDSLSNNSNFYPYFYSWYNLQDWVSVLIKNNLWEYVSIKIFNSYEFNINPDVWDDLLNEFSPMNSIFLEFINSGLSRITQLWCENDFSTSPEYLAGMVDYILSSNLYRLKNHDINA